MGMKCNVCGYAYGLAEYDDEFYCRDHRPDERDEREELEAEVARLREALVAHDPLIPSEYSQDCFYCDGFLSFGAYYKDGYIHDDDCPWAKAKALLP